MDWPAAHRFVTELGPAASRDLLRVLTSSSEVRADVIRQLDECGHEDMAELVILLEERSPSSFTPKTIRAWRSLL